jgi:LPS-assembly lipoprotein
VSLAAILLLAVGACGFQLRGDVELPPGVSVVQVQAPNQTLTDEITVFLEAAGARAISGPEGADASLLLSGESFERRVLAVDPNTGKAREYELSYRVSYRMSRADGGVLLAPDTVNLLRDYVFDADAVIGASREEVVLRQEMRRDAVRQILRKLEFVAEQERSAVS